MANSSIIADHIGILVDNVITPITHTERFHLFYEGNPTEFLLLGRGKSMAVPCTIPENMVRHALENPRARLEMLGKSP
jgi:hypothetical protein